VDTGGIGRTLRDPQLGAGYFDIDEHGNVTVSVPTLARAVAVSLMDLIAGMQQRGLQMARAAEARQPARCADRAAQRYLRQGDPGPGLQSEYHGVFPIKSTSNAR